MLRSTFAVVERRAEHAVTFFYAHLFWHNPALRELFPEDIRPQRDRLFAALGHVVDLLDDPDLPGYLERLGRDHRKFLATPALYSAVGTSLLAAFAFAAGPAWTPEAEKAWTEAYGAISDRMLAGADQAAGAGDPVWWDTDVLRHERYGPDLAVLTLLPRRPLAFHPGQYVSVGSPQRPRVWRTYSLADAPRPDGTVELHVSRIPGGALSTILVDGTAPGGRLRLGVPDGGLVARPVPGGPRTYICAGTGWAPMKALLSEAAEQEPGLRGRLFVVARAKEYLYGRRDVERLAARLEGLSVTYITPAPDHPRDQATERLVQALRACVHWDTHEVYLAGPPGFVTEITEVLVALGTHPDRVHHDRLPSVDPFVLRPTSPAERLIGPPVPSWHNPEARVPRPR
ncbi:MULTISPECIES: globin domain-containing protein [unclassified Streptomyces]|uniref:globin domain-containing protein n=1 Tax=unclassified Streptomyces TaxID=2593676 RepID=UPI0016604188|nr:MULTISPECIES: globin domain-containing protein [unclassified Streptomyces]MBD0708591.1 flavohemoprotein [Streptomyces sp. CBMA291]MBD0713146.1 flavohemoprotein [Streptomyces sp. CBMA370]